MIVRWSKFWKVRRMGHNLFIWCHKICLVNSCNMWSCKTSLRLNQDWHFFCKFCLQCFYLNIINYLFPFGLADYNRGHFLDLTEHSMNCTSTILVWAILSSFVVIIIVAFFINKIIEKQPFFTVDDSIQQYTVASLSLKSSKSALSD